jgi:hypothetical protein
MRDREETRLVARSFRSRLIDSSSEPGWPLMGDGEDVAGQISLTVVVRQEEE